MFYFGVAGLSQTSTYVCQASYLFKLGVNEYLSGTNMTLQVLFADSSEIPGTGRDLTGNGSPSSGKEGVQSIEP